MEALTEERFQLALEGVRDSAVFRLDADGNVASWDEGAQRVLGYAPIEIVGRPFARLYVDEEVEREQPAHDLRAACDNGISEGEGWRMRSDGSLLWAQTAITPLDDGFSCVLRDVTQRKQAEEELRETEVGFRLLVEGVKDYAIFILDPDGRVASWNTGAERMKGWTGAEIIGQPHARFYPTQDAGAGRPRADLDAALENGRHEAEGWRLRKDGTPFWANVVIAPLRDGENRLRGFSNVTRDMTERKRYEAELAHRALHDPLTGLPNRDLLVDRAAQALARAARDDCLVAVLFVDLDRFKLINDSLGHAAGDEALAQLADRLGRAVRGGDTVARFGGDEFVVLCESIEDAAEAELVAARVLELLREPLPVGGSELEVTASIGIAVAGGGEPEDLLRSADAALYAAKDAGRARVAIFDPATMQSSASERLAVERDLRRALSDGALSVVYQPQVDVVTGELRGVEALVRWRHPERGLVLPGEFIPLAEETGLIAEIGEVVLNDACRRAREWGRLKVAVNFSPAQLLSTDLVELVKDALARAGTDPRLLCLEITENVLMADAPASTATLNELKELGVDLAIDDFGTGWSSLAYLRRFPVTQLKIDSSFVQGLGERESDEAIVAAMIGMADALGLETVAEGVEEVRQLETLRGLGCPTAQGFLLAKPAPATEIRPR